MNFLWLIILIPSIALLLINNPSQILTCLLDTSSNTLTLCVELFSIYAVWLGIMEIVEKLGLTERFANKISPLITKLFRSNNKEANKYIALNLSANLLGLGNMATPSGITAMKLLDDKSGKPNYAMKMLAIINSLAIQILPTTIISIRAKMLSVNVGSIILPTLIATSCSTSFGIVCLSIFSKRKIKCKRY